VTLPLIVTFELLAVAVAHALCTIDALALTHEEVIVHVPTMLPPQAAVLLQVPPELPQPGGARAMNNPTADATPVTLMAQ